MKLEKYSKLNHHLYFFPLQDSNSFVIQVRKVGGELSLDSCPSTTLCETNIAPENRPLEKEIPIGNHHF